MKHLAKFESYDDGLFRRYHNITDNVPTSAKENDNDKDLIDAIDNNDQSEAERLLELGADPNYKQFSPIRHCTRKSNLDMLKLLVSYGATIKHPVNMPMAWAAENGKKDMMEYMIGFGVNTGFNSIKSWIRHTTKINRDEIRDMTNYIDELIESGKVKA